MSTAKSPSGGQRTWIYTPRPRKISDEAVFTSPSKAKETPLLQKLKTAQAESSRQTSVEFSDARPPAFGSAEVEKAMKDAKLDANYVKSVQTRIWNTIAPVSKPHQEVDVYVHLLALKRIIYEGELNTSLLRVFDEAGDESEGQNATVVTTPAPTQKKKQTAYKRETKRASNAETDGPHLRRSTREKGKSKPKTKPALKLSAAKAQLLPTRIGISSEVGIDNTEAIKNQFCDILGKVEVEIEKNRKKEVVRLHGDVQKDITNAFFNEFMSDRALSNIKAIINSYSKSFDGDLTAYNAIQAQQAAKTLPPALKTFADRLATSIGLQTTTGAFKVFQQYVADVTMYESYQQAVLATYENKEVKRFFKSRGYEPSRGRDWRSVLKDYFCDHISMTTPKAWNNLVHAVAPLWHLVRHFGMGVLLLLRGEHKTRFINIGVGTVNTVSPIVKAVAPDFAWGVQILSERVYPALVQGRIDELSEAHLMDRNGSFLANIKSCFDPDSTIECPPKVKLPILDTSSSDGGEDSETGEESEYSEGSESSEGSENSEGDGDDDSSSKMDTD